MTEEKVGKVAYRLRIPPESKIHPVFHISSLKKKLRSTIELQPRLALVNIDGSFFPEPEKILDRRIRQHGRRALTEILVKWVKMGEEDATWEKIRDFRDKFGGPWGQGP